MRTLLIALIALTLTASSCKTVYSTTTIEAKKVLYWETMNMMHLRQH